MRARHHDLRTRVELRCATGHPAVLRCHPLRLLDGRPEPFPTLFWLCCSHLEAAVSALEHGGLIQRLQDRIAVDEPFREEVRRDHLRYIEERHQQLDEAERELLRRAGREETLLSRGIGGIRNFLSVKCLHLHFAHHLARGSAIGRVVAGELPELGCLPGSGTKRESR